MQPSAINEITQIILVVAGVIAMLPAMFGILLSGRRVWLAGIGWFICYLMVTGAISSALRNPEWPVGVFAMLSGIMSIGSWIARFSRDAADNRVAPSNVSDQTALPAAAPSPSPGGLIGIQPPVTRQPPATR